MMTTPAPTTGRASARLVPLDAMRAFSMLYIIGYWHLFNYTNAFPGYYNGVTARITVCILGLFVLLSGYLAGNNAILPTWESVGRFYRTRLARIYPPYLIALIVFGVFGISDWITLGKAAALISMFAEPAPPTLWFITMIIFFYLITPVFLTHRAQGWKYLAIGVSCFLLLYLYEDSTGWLDPRIAMYLPCYLLGIYIAEHEIKLRTKSLLLIFAASAAAVFVSLYASGNIEQDFFSAPLALAGALAIFLLARSVKYSHGIAAIEMISAASYFMYLAHRPIFTLLKKIYFPASGIGQVVYLIFFCLPVVVVLSYRLQVLYAQRIRRTDAHAIPGAPQERILYIKGGRVIEEAQRIFPRIGELPDGGPDKFLLAVLHYSRQHVLRVASFGPRTQRTRESGREVIEYGARSESRRSVIRRLCFLRAVASFMVDTLRFKPTQLLCGVDGPFALCVWFAAVLSGSRFVLFAHNALALPSTTMPYKFANAFLCRHADLVVAHGPYVRDEAIRLGAESAKVIEFNNGLDADHEALIEALPPRDGASRTGFSILYVGRMEEDKGVIDLFNAFKMLPFDDDLTLCFIGEGSSNAVLAELIELTRLSDRVSVLGQLPYAEVFVHLAKASVLVTPSQAKFPEGFCKSAMEALYVGVPVIAPDYGPFPYMIVHGVNGLLYAPDDVEALAAALRRLIGDRLLRERLERAAKKSGAELMHPATTFAAAIQRVLA